MKTTDPVIKEIWSALNFNIAGLMDWDALLVLSDRFEDLGLMKETNTLRWMHRHQRRPWVSGINGQSEWWNGDRSDGGGDLHIDPDCPSDLPSKVFQHLKKGLPATDRGQTIFRLYQDVTFAILDLHQALREAGEL